MTPQNFKSLTTLLIGLLLLGLTGLPAHKIEDLKVEHELESVAHSDSNLPPNLIFTQVALGSMRGLVVDFLWARATYLQDEGRYFELMQLADWITKLQPSFSQVWVFQSWNLAYNLSVLPDDSLERWRWVRSGIDLLQNEALVLNPKLYELYEELAWIYYHKIGMFHDDRHFYYKQRWALEMERILGLPAGEGESVYGKSIDAIAQAYNDFVNEQTLPPNLWPQLWKLSELGIKKEDIRRLLSLSISKLKRKLSLLREREASPVLSQILAQLDSIEALGKLDPHERFLKRHPSAQNAIAELLQAKVQLGTPFLVRLNASQDHQSPPFKTWLTKHQNQPFFSDFVHWMRAQALVDDYNLNPSWMQTLHRGHWVSTLSTQARDPYWEKQEDKPLLPLDWRHPATHSLYWATLGLFRGQYQSRLKFEDQFDLHQIIRLALQNQCRSGNMIFNRKTGFLAQSVNLKWVAALEEFSFGDLSTAADSQKLPPHLQLSHQGHLKWAALTHYQYGNKEEAQKNFDFLRQGYPQATSAQSIEEFYQMEIDQDTDLAHPDHAKPIIEGYLYRALVEGYQVGKVEVAEQLTSLAEEVYNRHVEQLRIQSGDAPTSKRYTLPPFEELRRASLTRFFNRAPSPTHTLEMERRVWNSIPPKIREELKELIEAPPE